MGRGVVMILERAVRRMVGGGGMRCVLFGDADGVVGAFEYVYCID
jgi:hypothetical protein